MVKLNGKPLNHYPWRTMERGDLLHITGSHAEIWTRSTLYNEARKARPDLRPWCISPRPDGFYVAVPSVDNPTPIPKRPKRVKPADPVKTRRAERRAWHRASIGRPVVTVPLPKAPKPRKMDRYPFGSLEVGQSFVVDDPFVGSSVRVCARHYGRETGRRFEVKRVGEQIVCTSLPDPAYNPFD